MIVLMRVMLSVIHDAIDQMNFAIATKDATAIQRKIVVSYHLLIDVCIYNIHYNYVQPCVHAYHELLCVSQNLPY